MTECNEGAKRKRENESINWRTKTLIKKAHELGEFDGIDVALIICKRDRYTTYRSRDHPSFPPSMAEIVSSAPLIFGTGANTDLASYLSSPKEYIATRHGKALLLAKQGNRITPEG